MKYFRGKQLKDFVGNNDKTKIVVKLSTVGSGNNNECVNMHGVYHVHQTIVRSSCKGARDE